MREARCRVCGRGYREAAADSPTAEYELKFDPTVCELCGVTLARALAGFVELLRQSHGERRERVLDKLTARLREQGFSIDSFPNRRRSA
jgi:hypothetical protein